MIFSCFIQILSITLKESNAFLFIGSFYSVCHSVCLTCQLHKTQELTNWNSCQLITRSGKKYTYLIPPPLHWHQFVLVHSDKDPIKQRNSNHTYFQRLMFEHGAETQNHFRVVFILWSCQVCSMDFSINYIKTKSLQRFYSPYRNYPCFSIQFFSRCIN